MTKDEKALLDNLLNSLDRLYDRDSSATDVWALLFATSKALASSEFLPHIEPFVGKLLAIVRTRGSTGDSRRDAALVATDDLRKLLADWLPFPN
ncbi:MAG TPA: hypothetical protein VGM98_22360 [Schlesneria sp.]|jgi:hypothetical protein